VTSFVGTAECPTEFTPRIGIINTRLLTPQSSLQFMNTVIGASIHASRIKHMPSHCSHPNFPCYRHRSIVHRTNEIPSMHHTLNQQQLNSATIPLLSDIDPTSYKMETTVKDRPCHNSRLVSLGHYFEGRLSRLCSEYFPYSALSY